MQNRNTVAFLGIFFNKFLKMKNLQTKVCFKQFHFFNEIYLENLFPKKTKCPISYKTTFLYKFL